MNGEAGAAPIPAPRDGAEYVGGAAPGPSCREAPDIRRCSEAGPSRGRGRIKFLPQELRKELYAEALRLFSEGLGYKRIARELRKRFGASVSSSTLSYWVRGIYTPYYRRFPSRERLEIYREALRLHVEGYRCKEIAKMMSVSPSTVREWIAGKYSPYGPKPPLPLPAPRPSTHHPRRINLEPSVELAYIIGVVLGDGTATHDGNYGKVIALRAKDEEFVREFARCLTKALGRENPVKVWFWKTQKLFAAKAYSVALYRLLHKPVDLGRLRPFIEHCEECMAAFLRGFADSEGSVSEYGFIEIFNTDEELLSYVKELLNRLGIEATGPHLRFRAGKPIYDPKGRIYRLKRDFYKLQTRTCSAALFYQKIGLTITRKRQKLERYLSKHKPLLPTPSLYLYVH